MFSYTIWIAVSKIQTVGNYKVNNQVSSINKLHKGKKRKDIFLAPHLTSALTFPVVFKFGASPVGSLEKGS